VSTDRTLSELRAEFGRSRFLALPIAGAVAWAAAGALGAILPERQAAFALFFCLPAVFPLGILFARFTGEDLFGTKSHNELDSLFMSGLLMANLVWAIAIPFWMIEPSSLPLSAGILAGLMWIPFSWIIQHWVGVFHSVTRTVGVAAAWFLFPDHRFVVIPGVIVVVYLISIVALARRRLPEPRASTSLQAARAT
jgi:ethanolamine transporter EutH